MDFDGQLIKYRVYKEESLIKTVRDAIVQGKFTQLENSLKHSAFHVVSRKTPHPEVVLLFLKYLPLSDYELNRALQDSERENRNQGVVNALRQYIAERERVLAANISERQFKEAMDSYLDTQLHGAGYPE
jgi:hypothetical protein